jgi:hypothetical protein
MRSYFKVLFVFLTLIYSYGAWSHGRVVVPSHTIVSGDSPQAISISFSVTNDVFHADRGIIGIDLQKLVQLQNGDISVEEAFQPSNRGRMGPSEPVPLTIISPDGEKNSNTPFVNFGREAMSSAVLTQDGTYRLGIYAKPRTMTTYTTADGKRGRFLGSAAEAKLPEGTRDVTETVSHSVIETYVTRNDISEDILKPKSEGLELVFDTHPNELFVGEKTKIQVLVDGKKAQPETEVKLTLGGTRWRNNRDVRTLLTDTDGFVEMAWDQAGMWLLETSVNLKTKKKNKRKSYERFVTLEVNPE